MRSVDKKPNVWRLKVLRHLHSSVVPPVELSCSCQLLITAHLKLWRTRKIQSTGVIALGLVVLSGCAAVPLKKLQPVIAPPSASCTSDQTALLAGEVAHSPSRKTFQYLAPMRVAGSHPSSAADSQTAAFTSFESYYAAVQPATLAMLPPSLQKDGSLVG